MAEKVVIERIELINLCRQVLGGAAQILRGYDSNNPRSDRESPLLLGLCDVLFPSLGLERLAGVHDSGGPTLALDVQRKILEVLDGRIRGCSGLNDIIGVIRTYLLDPGLRDQAAGSY